MSDRFQRSRIPALPTVLFADASEDYRGMARDALLEGRNVTDMRTQRREHAHPMRPLRKNGSLNRSVNNPPYPPRGRTEF